MMSKVPTWNPGQYLKFAGQRLRPALDLLNQIDAEDPQSVFDLGCGPGNVTPFLQGRWPGAQITGIDTSDEMLAKAKAEHPTMNWVKGDGKTWAPDAPADVIYSNAALHWIDGHAELFPRLLACLKPGGTLAIQMPHNHKAPSHMGMREVVMSGAWQGRLEPIIRTEPVADPEVYYDILAPHAAHLNIWETTYAQVMEGNNPAAEFTKGSALKPFLDALTDADENREFFETYSARMQAAYPKRADGKTLFHFQRLFIVAKA
ncbi:MAG: methyltransferase domain-containing protein [Rhodospirillaceae bacterium]